MDIKPYKDFAEYVIEHSEKANEYYWLARDLKKEVKERMKDGKPLSWHWRTLAKELFAEFKIVDERINLDGIKNVVSFTYNDIEYDVDVLVDKDWREEADTAQLVRNSSFMEDEQFIVQTIKRYIDSERDIDTTKVYLYYNYLVVLLR